MRAAGIKQRMLCKVMAETQRDGWSPRFQCSEWPWAAAAAAGMPAAKQGEEASCKKPDSSHYSSLLVYMLQN